jgi:AcrR family transcriptional regulator
MGNRDSLLAGARRCLVEKGYARTTARDIATAADVSLAAIGYHFGSTEALLNAALHDAVVEWGDRVEAAVAAEAGGEHELAPRERFAQTWTRILASLDADRSLWGAQLEMVAQAQFVPELRERLAADAAEGRRGLADTFRHVIPHTDERQAELLGSLYQALLIGLAAQWAITPGSVPDGAALAEALEHLATGLTAT